MRVKNLGEAPKKCQILARAGTAAKNKNMSKLGAKQTPIFFVSIIVQRTLHIARAKLWPIAHVGQTIRRIVLSKLQRVRMT
jgi:hypothetical protein